jgi:hypothetical protein
MFCWIKNTKLIINDKFRTISHTGNPIPHNKIKTQELKEHRKTYKDIAKHHIPTDQRNTKPEQQHQIVQRINSTT